MSWFRHLFLLIFMFTAYLLKGVLFKTFRAKVEGRLRVATSGAGSLPKYLDEVFNADGMTECSPGILSLTVACNTFGSTGWPFDHIEVEIRREDGSAAATGEKGVVFVRGPQVMKGYYKNPEATTAVLDGDGWLNTGDLSVRSKNGEMIIVGRLKDTIVLGQDQKQLTAIVKVIE